MSPVACLLLVLVAVAIAVPGPAPDPPTLARQVRLPGRQSRSAALFFALLFAREFFYFRIEEQLDVCRDRPIRFFPPSFELLM